jgi:hypothetical protein
MDEKRAPVLTQEEVSEAIEHRDALLDVRAVLKTATGRRFFKYLVKNYSPIDPPPEGVEGVFLHEKLGMLRAWNELFKLMAEADPETAAQLLAENIKERYAKLFSQNPNEPSR